MGGGLGQFISYPCYPCHLLRPSVDRRFARKRSKKRINDLTNINLKAFVSLRLRGIRGLWFSTKGLSRIVRDFDRTLDFLHL
jgi:hypothetical protein